VFDVDHLVASSRLLGQHMKKRVLQTSYVSVVERSLSCQQNAVQDVTSEQLQYSQYCSGCTVVSTIHSCLLLMTELFQSPSLVSGMVFRSTSRQHRHWPSSTVASRPVSSGAASHDITSLFLPRSDNGPATSNHLPPALQSPDLSESAFKRALKTHLFSTARRH